jgi:2,4-dienoyl-CoA reductase-like NADH-dependent reductase (Old Yellow Enzyme family)
MLEKALRLPCGLTLPNRLAKAATTEALATADAQPGAALQALYARWSRSGAGLMVTGNVGVDPWHAVRPGDVMVDEHAQLGRLQAWSKVARAEGTPVVLQICHAGKQTQRWRNAHPLGPSATRAVEVLGAFGRPREMTVADIAEVQQRFVRAALLGEAAGFDGCQIHSAHGYLLSQFLSPSSNTRADAYGGSVENRARLLLEIVREVKRRRASPRYAVTVKLNSADFQRGGLTHTDSLEVVELLEAEGIDLLEISGGTYERPASFGDVAPSSAAREAYFLDFARDARARTRAPLMLTGGFRSRRAMEQALQEGALDVIGIARPFCVEPLLARRVLADPDATLPEPRRFEGWLRSLSEMAWYSEQLQRMGGGLDPDPAMSAPLAVARHLWRDLSRGLFQRPAPALPVTALKLESHTYAPSKVSTSDSGSVR